MDTKTRLKTLIADLFHCDVTALTDAIGPGMLPGWDSLGHVTLMAAIQKEFGRAVPIEDAVEVENIGDLARVLDDIES